MQAGKKALRVSFASSSLSAIALAQAGAFAVCFFSSFWVQLKMISRIPNGDFPVDRRRVGSQGVALPGGRISSPEFLTVFTPMGGQFDFTYLMMFFPVFLFALTIHEVAHALTANWGGDLTATYQNRLTLNPLHHIDPIGTVLVPLLVAWQGWGLFGWARPVPVDESRFKRKYWDVIVSLAGPYSNFLLVLVGLPLFRILHLLATGGADMGWYGLHPEYQDTVSNFIWIYTSLNWLLVFFNLLPVPPLDGSHVFYHFFIRGRGGRYGFWDTYRRFGFLLLFVLIQIPALAIAFFLPVYIMSKLSIFLLWNTQF